MVDYALLFVGAIAFFELLIGLKTLGDARGILTVSRQALDVVTSRQMDDLQKERAVRSLSLKTAVATLRFLGKMVVVIAGTALVTWIGCALLDRPIDGFLAFAQGWVPLLVVIVGMLVYAKVRGVKAG